MLIALLVAGFLMLCLVLKIAKGVIKLVLIIVLLALIAGGSVVTHNSAPLPPTSNS